MSESNVVSRVIEILCAFLLVAALATIQVLIGGTRLLFSLPTYGLLGIMGLLGLFLIRRAKPDPSRLCLMTAALFFGYILLRAYFSPVEYIARSDIYSVIGGLLVYFFVTCIWTDPKRRMLVLAFLLALALVHVFIGALQFRDGKNFMLIPFLARVDYGRRASGFYVCPNHLAGLLEVLGVFGLSIVCWSRWPTWVKLLIAYGTCLCYAGLVLTASRGGYLSTAASLAVFLLLSLALLRRASTSVFWKIGGPAVLVALLMLATAVFLIKKSDFLSGRAQTVFETKNMRVELWKAALDQAKLQPIIGTGSATYLYYGREFRREIVQQDPIYVHNDYLHLLAEYGLIGTALFLLFLGAHLYTAKKNLSRLGFKRVAISSRLLSNGMALQIGAVAALAAYLVHSIFDFNLHIPANVLLLAFVFGLIANPGASGEANLTQPTTGLMLWRLLPPVLGLILLVQAIRLLPGEYFTERARTALRDNQRLSAVSFANRGLQYEHKNPNLYQYLGSARIEQAQRMSDPEARASFYRAALEPFEAARALAPRDKTYPQALAYVLDALGRYSEAEWMWGEALRLDPRSTSTTSFYQKHLEQWRATGQ